MDWLLAQMKNVCRTTIVQNAWARGRDLSVHGLIYSLRDGLLHDLSTSITAATQLEEIHRMETR